MQRVKNREGKTQIFFVSGPDSQPDIFGPLFLVSQKSSQMAAYASKSKNVESAVNIKNLLSNNYPIVMSDLNYILNIQKVKILFCEIVWLDQI